MCGTVNTMMVLSYRVGKKLSFAHGGTLLYYIYMHWLAYVYDNRWCENIAEHGFFVVVSRAMGCIILYTVTSASVHSSTCVLVPYGGSNPTGKWVFHSASRVSYRE